MTRKDAWWLPFLITSVFLNYKDSSFCPACGQSWRIFWVHLRRVCILELSTGLLYKYRLSLSSLMCLWRPVFPYWFSFWIDLSINKSEMVKFTTVIVLLLIFPFMTVSIRLMYWGVAMLGAYIFITVVSSWLDALTIMQCPS